MEGGATVGRRRLRRKGVRSVRVALASSSPTSTSSY